VIGKKFFFASIAVFFVLFVYEFLLHGVALGGLYQQTAHLWRSHTEIRNLSWLMWLSYLVMSPILVLLFSKGYETGKPALGQGVRFGLLLGIFLSAPMALNCYAVMPISITLAAGWFIGGLVEMILCGVVIGMIWK
jgi:hypothetical protein